MYLIKKDRYIRTQNKNNIVKTRRKYMFKNKDIIKSLFPKWLKIIIFMIASVLTGVILFDVINIYSFLWGVAVGIIITIQYSE